MLKIWIFYRITRKNEIRNGVASTVTNLSARSYASVSKCILQGLESSAIFLTKWLRDDCFFDSEIRHENTSWAKFHLLALFALYFVISLKKRCAMPVKLDFIPKLCTTYFIETEYRSGHTTDWWCLLRFL